MTKKMQDYYDPFEKWQWRTFERGDLLNPIEFVNSHKDYMFFVGTDSQNHKRRGRRHCYFTSAIVAYKMGSGGVGIIHSDKVPIITNLHQRLMIEAMRSLECAWFINQRLVIIKRENIVEEIKQSKQNINQEELEIMVEIRMQDDTLVAICKPEIHLDVNMDEHYESARYRKELVGMVASQGFQVVCKPNAWVASKLADRRC